MDHVTKYLHGNHVHSPHAADRSHNKKKKLKKFKNYAEQQTTEAAVAEVRGQNKQPWQNTRSERVEF